MSPPKKNNPTDKHHPDDELKDIVRRIIEQNYIGRNRDPSDLYKQFCDALGIPTDPVVDEGQCDESDA